MASETMKSLRVRAEEMVDNGIANQGDLIAALPVLVNLKTAADNARKTASACGKIVTMLTELCTKYATAHPSIFEGKKLAVNQFGVRTGNVTVGEDTYHLTCGYEGYMRTEPKAVMTQDFLATLPEAWRKTKLEIDTTGINDAAPTDEELSAHGLKEKPKNEWSLLQSL